ncbi:hypothetical protein [Streptomyces fradiae]|uniref:Uncharacterized protein n=1 Tax=Streptomyces fradiae ATCC 10745 = DSM 40063 TaxID=1319510 RepID=A0A1Y2NTZ4_STRFR|nr:hypothetical protein [Streptomyces fradiae]KAF0650225.1 hypothetical protein K701_08710 [Streptomyces fradiae ATCC 10745 = DSM 40063]OSY50956.1 hypothetical protein BG846_03386 [Streptomyces fradiae ATCC 10745 = DSM 40063]QEV12291.1 hypothetical protein CP974_09925 [Streptomyces fradiae ATCC 10745 = DSM 40063]
MGRCAASVTWIDRTDPARYALIPEELRPAWAGAEAEAEAEADEAITESVSAVRLADHDVLTLGGGPLLPGLLGAWSESRDGGGGAWLGSRYGPQRE